MLLGDRKNNLEITRERMYEFVGLSVSGSSSSSSLYWPSVANAPNVLQPYWLIVQCDSFGTRPKKMRISQRLFIRF